MSDINISDVEREMYVCTDMTDREKRLLAALQQAMDTTNTLWTGTRKPALKMQSMGDLIDGEIK